MTVSPGETLTDLPRFAFPDPPCGDSKICAQGKFSFGNSVISAG